MKNLYKDRQQFNHYQQNEHPPPTSTQWTYNKPRYVTLEIQIKMSELFNSNEKFYN